MDYSMQGARPMKKEKRDNRVLAVIAMNIFAVCNVGQGVLFKKIQAQGVHIFEFTIIRNSFNLFGALVLSLIYSIRPVRDFPKEYRGIMAVRATFGQITFILFMSCLALLPLAIQMVIFQTSPFWAAIIARIFLKEAMSNLEIVAMIISFGGVMTIAFANPDAAGGEDGENLTKIIGICMALAAAWLFAASNVINRYLKNMHFSMVLFYHALCGVILASSAILIEKLVTGNPFRVYTANQYKNMLFCCCFDFSMVNA